MRVKKQVKELGYTGNYLAEKINARYATVSRIYRGLSVKIEYIYELRESLNISTGYLLKGSEGNSEIKR